MSDTELLTLGIETSCDDTSAAVLRGGRVLESNVVSSQVSLHGQYGGVVPELASREHIRNIHPVVEEALAQAGVTRRELGLVAVTRGPGLIGSLLVGLNYAKSLAYAQGIPFIGVNHLEGHFVSSFIEHPDIEYPLICLIVSGGHTSLYHAPCFGEFRLLAATRDDAAGEAYDKVAKMLGLPYPGGPVIDRLASGYDGPEVTFPLPRISDGSLDFSFSGLKTAVLHHIRNNGIPAVASPEDVAEPVLALLKGFQTAAVRQLIHRVKAFCDELRPASFILGGGVACNSELRRRTREEIEVMGIRTYYPSPILTTDNAAMIALAGHLRFAGTGDSLDMNAAASLALGE